VFATATLSLHVDVHAVDADLRSTRDCFAFSPHSFAAALFAVRDFFLLSTHAFLQSLPALPFAHALKQVRTSNIAGRFLRQALTSNLAGKLLEQLAWQALRSKPALSVHAVLLLQPALQLASLLLNSSLASLFALLPVHAFLQSKQAPQAFLKLSVSSVSEFWASRQTSVLEQLSAHSSTSHAFSGSYFTPALHVAAKSFLLPLPPLPPTLIFPAPLRPVLLRVGKSGFTKSQAGKSSNSSSINNW
jgi:hypothetical protein